MIQNFTPIQRRGISAQTGTANATLVASGANVNGIILRTFNIRAGSGNECWVEIGGNAIFLTNSGEYLWSGTFFIPAGNALAMAGSGGAFRWGASWDLL